MSNSSNNLVRLLLIVYIQVKSAKIRALEAFARAVSEKCGIKKSRKTVNLQIITEAF